MATANPQKIVMVVLCGAMLNLAPPARICSHLQDSTGSGHLKLVPPLPRPFPTPEKLERNKKEEKVPEYQSQGLIIQKETSED